MASVSVNISSFSKHEIDTSANASMTHVNDSVDKHVVNGAMRENVEDIAKALEYPSSDNDIDDTERTDSSWNVHKIIRQSESMLS
jgi:hypothetical protein